MPVASYAKRLHHLMTELHSFASLIEKIEKSDCEPTTEELESLSKSLATGMDIAFELTKQLNKTALALHVELLARRGRHKAKLP